MLLRPAGGRFGGHLRGIRSGLTRSLEPHLTGLAQEITLPCGSVIETIVLLNVLLMCATPWATFFFSLRRTLAVLVPVA
jgi:hypothetical protein